MHKHATNRPKVHLKRFINRGPKTGRKRKIKLVKAGNKETQKIAVESKTELTDAKRFKFQYRFTLGVYTGVEVSATSLNIRY